MLLLRGREATCALLLLRGRETRPGEALLAVGAAEKKAGVNGEDAGDGGLL